MHLSNTDNAKLKQIEKFIVENASRRVLVQELVSLSGMSESKFNKAFKFKYQISAHQYWLEASMIAAKAFLANGSKVKDVALSLGYSDPGSFRRAFKKHNLTNPTATKTR